MALSIGTSPDPSNPNAAQGSVGVQPKPHIFLFHGTDGYSIAEKVLLWRREFEKKYAAANCSVLDCEELKAEDNLKNRISQLLRGATLFSATKLVIVRHIFSKKTPKAALEIFTEALESIPPTHFVVFQEDKADMRTAFFKKCKNLPEKVQVQEYLLPRGRELALWARNYLKTRQTQIESSALEAFVRRIDPAHDGPAWEQGEIEWNLWIVASELEKLRAYAPGRVIMKDDISLLTPENPAAHIFTLVDALAGKQRPKARRLASLLIGDGAQAKSAAMGIASMLIGQFGSFVAIKDLQAVGLSENAVAQKLGWKPQRLWVVKKKIASLSRDLLRTCYKELVEIESLLKSTSAHPLTLFERIIQKL